jgi:polyisoprenoid-binding protein YceI
MLSKKYLFFVLSLFVSLPATAQIYETQAGQAEFTGSTPLFSFEGTSDSLNGSVNLADSTINFQLPVKSIDTGNGKRNRDMLEVLEAEKYPLATFKGKIISDFNPDTSISQDVTVKGDFAVHGVSRTLEIPGTLQIDKQGLRVEASWSQKLTAYDIKPPSVLFYKMKDEHEVRLNAFLKTKNNN